MRRTLLSFILLSCFVGTMAQHFEGPQTEIDAILAAGKHFSAHVVAARVDSIAAYNRRWQGLPEPLGHPGGAKRHPEDVGDAR